MGEVSIKNFVNQIKRLPNPIIILDNKSGYLPIFDYYNELKNELKDKIDIRLLDQNYGHNVYLTLKDTLPNIYILSDPDLELNKEMPSNVGEILLKLSDKYKKYKVGLALDISDKDKYIKCSNYTSEKSIIEWESQYWQNKIDDTEYELYNVHIDTTFCLINNYYYNGNKFDAIRVAGIFTAKHLPWYENYIKDTLLPDEYNYWIKNNISSSILNSCISIKGGYK